MLVPLGILFLRLCLPSALAAAVPTIYAPVLERRAIDEEGLRRLGFSFAEGRCFRLDASGSLLTPALTPEQLDAALSERTASAGETPARKPFALPRIEFPKGVEAPQLGTIFDGNSSISGVVPVSASAPPPQETFGPPAPFVEQPFDDSWTQTRANLNDPKRRSQGLKDLSSRFALDEASETGLTPDAPEALRLLALTIHEGRGGTAAAVEFKRELSLAANLEPGQKAAFARTLSSPLTVYAALGRSYAPHALDSQLYFKRMEVLLDGEGRSLTGFIQEVDPKGKRAANFLLRSHAYDALIPHLNRRPAEAARIAPMLFPDRPKEIREKASQLEGLITQLAAKGRRSGALSSFIRGLQDQAGSVSDSAALRIAVYLKVNENILPASERNNIDELAKRIPPGLLESSGLLPPEPYDSWPADSWNFVLHFASTDSFKAWQKRFVERGYAPEPGADKETASVSRMFGPLKITLTARLYPGDKEGFMRGGVAKKFLADVKRDLRDPSVQGVMMRNHAQFHIADLFGKKVTPNKLVLDGACRSAWDLQTLRSRCPTCSFIVNTGTGRGHLNNEAALAVIEGLARRAGWVEIGEEWTRLDPSASRIQGPWTPPYAEALAILEADEKISRRKAAAS